MKIIFFILLLMIMSSCSFTKEEQPVKNQKSTNIGLTPNENQETLYMGEAEEKLAAQKNWKPLNNYYFLGMDIDLVHTRGANYKLIAKNVPGATEKVEVLSCDPQKPGEYKKDWQKISGFPKNGKAFIYQVKPYYGTLCKLPYKIQLTGEYGVKNITIDLHLDFINQFNNPKEGQRKRWPMRSVHLNTFTMLKDGEIAVDKNLLFDTYFANYTELIVSLVKNYRTYSYYKGLLIGDGSIISYKYPRNDKRQLFFYDRMPIDLATFTHLQWSYFQDKNGYYQLSDSNDRKLIILGDTSRRFDILSRKVYRYGDAFFYGDTELQGIDADTFEVFSYKDRKIYNNETPEVSAFARDKNKVYFQIDTEYGNKAEQKYLAALQADFDTLKYYELDLTKSWIFTDKNTIFFPSGKIMKNTFDGSSFGKYEEGNIFLDKTGVYFFLNEQIIPFDKATFKQFGSGIIKDKNKMYIGVHRSELPAHSLEVITDKPVVSVKLEGKYYRNCIEQITPQSILDLAALHKAEKDTKTTAWREFSKKLLHDDPKELYRNVCN